MKNMITLSNTISLLRAPLAFLFLFNSIKIRVFAIVAAMVTDCIDGFLARKFNHETFLGKVLDPVMDKFFVYFVMGVLAFGGQLTTFGLIAMLARDASIILYIVTTLLIYGKQGLVYVPAYASKITTALQFFTLFALVLGYMPPRYVYSLFFILAGIIYIELIAHTLLRNKKL